MTNQQQQLNYYQLMIELDDIYDLASSHYNEHILPEIERNQKLTAYTSQRVFVPTSVLTTVPSEAKLEDCHLNDNRRRENSELKSKVHLKLIDFSNRLLM